MNASVKWIYKFESRFDKCAKRFIFHHPFIAFLVMFIGAPIFIIIVVAAFSILITFPVAWMFGWV